MDIRIPSNLAALNRATTSRVKVVRIAPKQTGFTQQNKNKKKKNKQRKNNQSPGGAPSRQMVAAAYGRRFSAPVPMIDGRPFGRGSGVTITHSELVGGVPGSILFATQYYTLNPALPYGVNAVDTGPWTWLPALASRFEKYEVLGARLRYETDCATTTSGSVFLGVDFDCLDALPVGRTNFMNIEGAQRASSWQSFSYVFPRHNLCDRGALYLRNQFNPVGTDRKTYDLGSILISTQGQPGTAEVGEIYIDYTIRLTNPQLQPVVSGVPVPVLQLAGVTSSAPTLNNWLHQATPNPGDNLGSVPGPDSFTFTAVGPGRWVYTLIAIGTVAQWVSVPPTSQTVQVLGPVNLIFGGVPTFGGISPPSFNAQQLAGAGRFDTTATGVVTITIDPILKAFLNTSGSAPQFVSIKVMRVPPSTFVDECHGGVEIEQLELGWNDLSAATVRKFLSGKMPT